MSSKDTGMNGEGGRMWDESETETEQTAAVTAHVPSIARHG